MAHLDGKHSQGPTDSSPGTPGKRSQDCCLCRCLKATACSSTPTENILSYHLERLSQMVSSLRFSWTSSPLPKSSCKSVVFVAPWHFCYSTDHWGHLVTCLLPTIRQWDPWWPEFALSSRKALHMPLRPQCESPTQQWPLLPSYKQNTSFMWKG